MHAAVIDPNQFRAALGAFATGVTVITARDPDGAYVGITANSFNSVSLDPPLVLWSLDRSSRSLAAFQRASHFAVNVLAADQVSLSKHFARPIDDKFAGLPFECGAGDAPLLGGCAARFQCRKTFEYEGGDHLIFVGEVIAFNDSGRSALVYHKGRYAVSEPHPVTAADTDTDDAAAPAGGFIDDYLDYLLAHAADAFKQHFQPIADRAGLAMDEWFVLASLSDRDGQSEVALAEETLLTAPALRALLAGLVERGLLTAAERSAGRPRRWFLSEAGRAQVIGMLAAAKAHEADALGEFTADEARALKDALKRLTRWLRHAPPALAPAGGERGQPR